MPHFNDPHGPRTVHERVKERNALVAKIPTLSATSVAYAELVCCTNFSFLRGASHPEVLVQRAIEKGLSALAITDWHSLAGVVRAHAAAKEHGLKLLVGARLPLNDGITLCLYAMNRNGYGNLCRLLSMGKQRAKKGEFDLGFADLDPFSDGLHAVLLACKNPATECLEHLPSVFRDRCSVAAMRHMDAVQEHGVRAARALATRLDVPLVAINDVHVHDPSDKPLQDVLTCVREGVRIADSAQHLFSNSERHIKSGAEMAALFSDMPDAIQRGLDIANACTFSLDELKYEYPHELTEDGLCPREYLRRETMRGALKRYPEGVPDSVAAKLEHELGLIRELEYEPYFLTVYDIVRFARDRGILCQGRGSAANSAVCFCLSITSVDPSIHDLLFERFLSKERAEPPDIDVDFEHERREEVIQYVYEKYGRERAGMCATVIHYRTRSAVRQVGRVFGLTLDQVNRLSKSHQWFDDVKANAKRLREAGLDPASKDLQTVLEFARKIKGFPRHLSQHVGGMVMTQGRLDELVPIENAAMKNRSVIEWDKDDIDALGILKVDLLSLGMLTAIRKCFGMIAKHGGRQFDLATCLATDPDGQGQSDEAKAVYEMLCHADSIGTFQVESRAQMSMLPRLQPRRFYDLVVEVAIVRPGPIQGGMVHPYLRRRNKEEPVDYPHPDAIPALKKTLGVPLFQEQVMRLAVDIAGFSPGEADNLRKAMGGWRRPGLIDQYHRKLIDGMRARGISDEYAERVYGQIQGFGEYGFPESHSVSFALLTYVSSYLKRFYPAAFTASLLNSQPMGFYSASALLRDVRSHGVQVLPIDVNHSDWDNVLEPNGDYDSASLDAAPDQWGVRGPSLRLGMRQIKGLRRDLAEAVMKARGNKEFQSPSDFASRMRFALPSSDMKQFSLLAVAGAFDSTGFERREALWQLLSYRRKETNLFGESISTESRPDLQTLSDFEQMCLDYDATKLSLDFHPIQFIRPALSKKNVLSSRQLAEAKHGQRVRVAGLIVVRQRPGEGKMLFFTLEDEFGTSNLMMVPPVFEQFREVALSNRPVIAEGKVERSGEVIHLRVRRFEHGPSALSESLPTTSSRDFH